MRLVEYRIKLLIFLMWNLINFNVKFTRKI